MLWIREGNTLEFLLSPTRDAQAAKRFFAKTLAASHSSTPRVITVDKNAAYPKAFKELKAERLMPDGCELRRSKYLNNLVEQDHRFIKRLVKLGMGFSSFETAWRTVQGYEAMHMRRSGQIHGVEKGESIKQVACIASLFGVAVSAERESEIARLQHSSQISCNTTFDICIVRKNRLKFAFTPI